MTRYLLLALALTLAAPAANALTQLERSVQRELRVHGFDEVDVRSLDTAQLSAIYQIAHLKSDEGNKRGRIRSILGGRYSLRGLFLGGS